MLEYKWQAFRHIFSLKCHSSIDWLTKHSHSAYNGTPMFPTKRPQNEQSFMAHSSTHVLRALVRWPSSTGVKNGQTFQSLQKNLSDHQCYQHPWCLIKGKSWVAGKLLQDCSNYIRHKAEFLTGIQERFWVKQLQSPKFLVTPYSRISKGWSDMSAWYIWARWLRVLTTWFSGNQEKEFRL